jgi:hypothetical protein
MSVSIDLVNVYDRGKTVPMYHVRGVSRETWHTHEPIENSYYVSQDDYSTPLFRSYESAMKALLKIDW